MKTNQKQDPENYAKMSIPFESEDAANDTLNKFYEEVAEIRKKHNISDVLLIIKDSVFKSDGTPSVFMGNLFCGNGLNSESMAAWAYGQASKEREELIGNYLASKM